MVETLDRAMDRIKAVEGDAEKERQEGVAREKQRVRDYYERTRRKMKPEVVKGGEKAVRQLMKPTVDAIDLARRKFAEALKEGEAMG